ncbi:MAG: response regulator [Deltaproteobacteria bacterium]|nr:response regulator [Deltaproteobacteria bacterium]MBW2417706.1 response regulator [Deltaproteobacteria bacterium]
MSRGAAGSAASAAEALPTASWWPVAIAVTVAISAFGVAHMVSKSQSHGLHRATEAAMHQMQAVTEARMETQVRALARVVRYWEQARGLTEEEFVSHATNLVRDFEYIRSIQWMDESRVFRWAVPAETGTGLIGSRIGDDQIEKQKYERAKVGGGPKVSPAVDLLSGGRGFVIVDDIEFDGEVHGYIIGVYSAATSMSAILEHVAIGFDVAIETEGGELWRRSSAAGSAWSPVLGEVRIRNRVWKLSVTPSPAVAATYENLLPEFIAGAGIVFAILFGHAIRTAAIARWRSARLAEANRDLRVEFDRRMRAEVAEKEVRAELVTVLDSLPAYVWSAEVRPGGEFDMRYQSKAVEAITGRSASFFASQSGGWMNCVHPADREVVADAFRRLVRGDADESSREYRLVRPDGEVRFLRDRVHVRRTETGRRFDGVVVDYTDLRRAEDERLQLEDSLQQAQKLESLGALAGGIAHDFNNLLVAMLGHASLAREDLPADSPLHSQLEKIENAARSAAELCRQMLAYAGMGSVDVAKIDLRDIVQETGELLRASIPRTTELRFELGERPAIVEADSSQIRQIVLNLMTNAAEAIEDGSGKITLTICQRSVDDATRAASLFGDDLPSGACVGISVRDDGCGMDEETKRRIFEPFFSTKFRGRGLGLAAVLGIVRRCHGALGIESEPGAGTTMTVLFPAAEAGMAPVRRAGEAPVSSTGSGLVMLVEDDDAAREFASLVLERAGFEVLRAADGVEALELFDKHAASVRCVVLDLTMPRMDGEETYRQLAARSSDVPVILCSGYPECDAVARFGSLGLAGFLEKPYEPQSLVRSVSVACAEHGQGDAPCEAPS